MLARGAAWSGGRTGVKQCHFYQPSLGMAYTTYNNCDWGDALLLFYTHLRSGRIACEVDEVDMFYCCVVPVVYVVIRRHYYVVMRKPAHRNTSTSTQQTCCQLPQHISGPQSCKPAINMGKSCDDNVDICGYHDQKLNAQELGSSYPHISIPIYLIWIDA